MLGIIHTNRYKTSVEGSELFGVPRELAQLARAVGSPIPSVEHQEHTLAVHGCEVKSFVALVLEGEIRGQLAFCRCDLGLGQDLLSRDNSGQQQESGDLNQSTLRHVGGFYYSLEVAIPANLAEIY
jgi:hypothetical protein